MPSNYASPWLSFSLEQLGFCSQIFYGFFIASSVFIYSLFFIFLMCVCARGFVRFHRCCQTVNLKNDLIFFIILFPSRIFSVFCFFLRIFISPSCLKEKRSFRWDFSREKALQLKNANILKSVDPPRHFFRVKYWIS